MSKLVNRIKQENEESGVMIDQLARFATKKKTIRGSIEPHQDALDHPAQKADSDMEDAPIDDLDGNVGGGDHALDISDEEE